MSPPIDPDPPELADSLDIAGDWKIIYSWAPEVAPVPGGQTYYAHFDEAGRGDHGGVKFKGAFVDDPTAAPPPHSHAPAAQPGVFYGETLYDGRGVYLVQMLMSYDTYRYYELHNGRHRPELPGRPVDGAYVDVGARRLGGVLGEGYFGRFTMYKA